MPKIAYVLLALYAAYFAGIAILSSHHNVGFYASMGMSTFCVEAILVGAWRNLAR